MFARVRKELVLEGGGGSVDIDRFTRLIAYKNTMSDEMMMWYAIRDIHWLETDVLFWTIGL